MTEDEATIINLAKVVASQAGDMIFHQHTEARLEALVQSLRDENAALTERAEKAEIQAEQHLEARKQLHAQLGKVRSMLGAASKVLDRSYRLLEEPADPFGQLDGRVNKAAALVQQAIDEAHQ